MSDVSVSGRGRDSTTTPVGAREPKFRWWYESVIDWMLANPDKSQGDCARRFKVSQPWLSVILKSSAFREQYAIRRQRMSQQLEDKLVTATTKLALASVEKLTERIEDPVFGGVSFKDLSGVAGMSLERLGFGQAPAAAPAGVVVNIANGGASVEALKEARERIRQQQGDLEGSAREVSQNSNANRGQPVTAGNEDPLLVDGVARALPMDTSAPVDVLVDEGSGEGDEVSGSEPGPFVVIPAGVS